MGDPFLFKDSRGYVQIADIADYVLHQFGALEAGRVVIDFLRLTTSHIELVLVDKHADPVTAGSLFTVKVTRGNEVEVYHALPLAQQPILERTKSSRSVTSETYSPQGFEMISSAQSVSDLVFDLTTCMKRHWTQFNYKDLVPLMRRASFQLPFAIPTGIAVEAQLKKLKMGAQAWYFKAPAMPNFEFSVVGMYQDSGPAWK